MPILSTYSALSARSFGFGSSAAGSGGFGFITSWQVPYNMYSGWLASIPEIQFDGSGDIYYTIYAVQNSSVGIYVKHTNGIENVVSQGWLYGSAELPDPLQSNHISVANNGSFVCSANITVSGVLPTSAHTGYVPGRLNQLVYSFPNPYFAGGGVQTASTFDDNNTFWSCATPSYNDPTGPYSYVRHYDNVSDVLYRLPFGGTITQILAKTNLAMYLSATNSLMRTTNTGTYLYGHSSSNFRKIALDSSDNLYVWLSYTQGISTFLAARKYDSIGNVLWTRKIYVGNIGGVIQSIDNFTVDNDGNCYFIYRTNLYTCITSTDPDFNHRFTNRFDSSFATSDFKANGNYMVFSTVNEPYVNVVALPIGGSIPVPGYYYNTGILLGYYSVDISPATTDLTITTSVYGGSLTSGGPAYHQDGYVYRPDNLTESSAIIG